MTNRTKWSIDKSHSEIGFKIKHLTIAHVKGRFKTFDANIYTIDKDFTTAEIDLRIDASSITTGDAKRDEHLKSTGFFDAQKYKHIIFNSRYIQQSEKSDNYILWGELTIKGITKRIKLNVQFGGIVKDPWGKEKAGFAVTGKINRSDWELVWNTSLEAGGLMVSEEVIILCDLELINVNQKDLAAELEFSAQKENIL
ncbi:MAG: YceI family protein [Bacteroidetes bacterium]|nr:YceI family protein [Bacteroidota bacterium]